MLKILNKISTCEDIQFLQIDIDFLRTCFYDNLNSDIDALLALLKKEIKNNSND